MIQAVKDILSKKHFNIEEDSVDILQYQYVLYNYLKYHLLADEPPTFKGIALLVFVLLTGTSAFGLTLISFGHGVMTQDLMVCTEDGTYAALAVFWVVFPVSNLVLKRHYINLQTTMQADFEFVRRKGGNYRKKYFELQLGAWKATFAAMVFIVAPICFLVLMSSLSIVVNMLLYTPGGDFERSHVFPLWLPDINVLDTPYFEFFSVVSLLFLLGFGIAFSNFMVMFVAWIAQMYIKVEMVAWGICGLLENIREPRDHDSLLITRAVLMARMRDIVQQHCDTYSLLDNFATVFSRLLMYQQKATVPVTCLTLFVTVEGIGTGDLNLIMLVVFVAGCLQLYIICYAYSVVVEKLSSIVVECGKVEWWTIGRGAACVRADLQLLMMRALRVPSLRSPGFKDVSLETFSAAMTSAYSCFNMLRQVK